MPLDSLGYDRDNDFYRNLFLTAKLKFAWLPKKCNISGKSIWLEYGYELTAIWRNADRDSIYEERWHDKHEHIIWKLKR